MNFFFPADTVGPSYQEVSHPWIQPNTEGKQYFYIPNCRFPTSHQKYKYGTIAGWATKPSRRKRLLLAPLSVFEGRHSLSTWAASLFPNGDLIFKLDCSVLRRLYFLFHAWCSTGFQKGANFSVFSKFACCSKIWKGPFQSWMERWKSSSI